MAISFRVPTREIQGVQSAVRGITELVGSPAPLMKAWGEITLREVHDTIKAGGKPAWAPLKESTISAKRQGKGKGSPQPLSGLAQTFKYDAQVSKVVIYSDSPVAGFHEYGTKGPYEIRAKHGKALALPALPGRDAGATKPGRFSLSGLGRSRPTGRGSFTFQPVGKVPKRFRGREGKAVVPYSAVAFYQKVIHPGLPARPMFPEPGRLIPLLQKAAHALFELVILRRGGKAA